MTQICPSSEVIGVYMYEKSGKFLHSRLIFQKQDIVKAAVSQVTFNLYFQWTHHLNWAYKRCSWDVETTYEQLMYIQPKSCVHWISYIFVYFQHLTHYLSLNIIYRSNLYPSKIWVFHLLTCLSQPSAYSKPEKYVETAFRKNSVENSWNNVKDSVVPTLLCWFVCEFGEKFLMLSKMPDLKVIRLMNSFKLHQTSAQ